MKSLVPILPFLLLLGARNTSTSKRTDWRAGAGLLLAIGAALPLLDATVLLVREYDRSQRGRVVAGVVVGKLSSTGADGSRTIGSRRRWRAGRPMPVVVTSRGFQFYDVLARMILTGSPDAWFIEYRYRCHRARDCWRRESVSRAAWSELRIGQAVNVRTRSDEDYGGRLDDNPPWSTALAKLGVGGTLAVLAMLVSGRWPARRRLYLAAPGVVTSVQPIGDAEQVRSWRVRFAYAVPDGTTWESEDEVYLPGVQVGDACTAVYPPDNPALGTVRLSDGASHSLIRRSSPSPRARSVAPGRSTAAPT